MNIEELARKAHEAHELTLIERFKSGRTLLSWEQEGREHRAAWHAAVAAVLAEVGWQSLHHGLDRDTGLTCGMWEELPNGKHRWYVNPQQMCPGFAIQRGYTHYLPEPEPPAREEEGRG